MRCSFSKNMLRKPTNGCDSNASRALYSQHLCAQNFRIFFFGSQNPNTSFQQHILMLPGENFLVLSLYLENFHFSPAYIANTFVHRIFGIFFFGFQNPNTSFQQLIVMFPDVCLTFLVCHLCWRFSEFNIDKFQNFENFCT